MSLLEKTRRVNKLLQKSAGYPVDFEEICNILSELINGNVYVVSRKGKILGHALVDGYECDVMQEEILKEGRFPTEYNEYLLKFIETSANIKQAGQCVLPVASTASSPNKCSPLFPSTAPGIASVP